MNDEKVVIYHSDRKYAEALSNYINRKDLHLCAIFFTEEESLFDYLQENSGDILLCEAEIADSKRLGLLTRKLFYLVEEENKTAKRNEICMYSSAEKILENLLSDKEITEQKLTYDRFLSVINPVCSSLSDSYSLTLANKIYGLDMVAEKSVLLLCFSPLFRPESIETSVNSMSDLLYRVADSGEANWNSFVHKENGIDIIAGFSFWTDADEFTEENARKLAELLMKSEYKHIVMSFGALHGFCLPLLELSDKIIIPQKEENENYRAELKRQLFFAGKEEIINRFEEEHV